MTFIDDVVVFSTSAEEQALRLVNALRRFDEANLLLHPGMCMFAQARVQYLGFFLPEEGNSASLEKSKSF
jgi:hypothetical protein